MHIYFYLKTIDALELPISYNHIIQAAIYNSIEPELASFLHEKGFIGGGRRFKLFSFSRIIGGYQIDQKNGKISFAGGVKLVVSSPIERFCQSIANCILTKGYIRFGNSDVQIDKIMVDQFKADDRKIVLKTLSPIVVYSTLLKPNGGKFTCYFQPGEPEYDLLIENNLRKKYQAFYAKEAPAGEVKVRRNGIMRQNIINYKNTIIKGYTGEVTLTGPIELLQMAVDAGLGSKNGQGFGCVEISKRVS